MVRVLLPNGKLGTACSMDAVCEEVVKIEGGARRVSKKTDDISNANAVRIEFEDKCFLIGGISSEKVKAVLSDAVAKGYLNCLDLCLKVVGNADEIEDGVPYIEETGFAEEEGWGTPGSARDPFSPEPFSPFNHQPICCNGGFGQPACCNGGFGQPVCCNGGFGGRL